MLRVVQRNGSAVQTFAALLEGPALVRLCFVFIVCIEYGCYESFSSQHSNGGHDYL